MQQDRAPRKYKAVHQPCPSCGSSDALAIFEDDGSICFSCGKTTRGTASQAGDYRPTTYQRQERKVPLQESGLVTALADRNITKEVAEKFNVRTASLNGTITHHYYPYYNPSNELIAKKTRQVDNKSFRFEGGSEGRLLFGQHLFPPSSAKAITVFEGELDALAGYQMGGNFPCVSVANGAQAAYNELRKHIEYFETFETVVLCFDADRPGQEAARACATLFSPGKVKIFKHEQGFKDACDYLKAGKEILFKSLWWKSPVYAPEGIVPCSQLKDRILNRKKKSSTPYPWIGLNRLTYGIRKSEVALIAARRGAGKTQMLREIVYHLMQTDKNHKIGTMFLEELPEDSGLGLVSIHANQMLHLPKHISDEEEDEETKETESKMLEELITSVFSGDSVYFYDSFGQNDIQKLMSRIRYYVKGLGCQYLILDHLGIVASDHSQGDERKRLDDVITALKALAIELDIAILATIHLNREGQIRGSDGPENYANIVMHLERDVAASDSVERALTRVTVTKNRFYGAGTGPACALYGNPQTGRLEEVDEEALNMLKAQSAQKELEKFAGVSSSDSSEKDEFNFDDL